MKNSADKRVGREIKFLLIFESLEMKLYLDETSRAGLRAINYERLHLIETEFKR